jgi:hypothetical protein
MALGLRFARIRSLRSATLRLAYARRNVVGRQPLAASFGPCYSSKDARASGRRAHLYYSQDMVY